MPFFHELAVDLFSNFRLWIFHFKEYLVINVLILHALGNALRRQIFYSRALVISASEREKLTLF